MNRMRLRIAERLKQSQNTAASLTTFNEVDMSALVEMRKLYKDKVLDKTGIKLGFMSAFTRACVLASKDVPAVNASIEGPNGGDTIVYRDYVDVSVAVATEKGLVTPVVRNAEALDFVGIEKAIAELGKKARDGKLTIEDMAGGTFTVSAPPPLHLPSVSLMPLFYHFFRSPTVVSSGMSRVSDNEKLSLLIHRDSSLYGTPIINLPQTAVLGLHAIKDKPVAINGKVEIRPVRTAILKFPKHILIAPTDDVPCPHLRSPSPRWPRGSHLPSKGQGLH